MTRTVTWYVRLRERFPPERPVARLMARLMVLWADMALEYSALSSEAEGPGSAWAELDRFEPLYRRLYFWRGLTRTIYSAQKLFNELMRDVEFRGWLADGTEMGQVFKDKKRAFDKLIDQVVTLRNHVGAHVEEHVGEALQYVDDDQMGPLELAGDDVLRPRLAVYFVLATVLPASPSERRAEEFKAVLSTVKEAHAAMVGAMAAALHLYNKHYRLLPR